MVLSGLRISGNAISEKPDGEGGWINGGYFVVEPSAIDLIDGDNSIWEQEPLKTLANQGQLNAYIHDGFWQPMDTLRDRQSWKNSGRLIRHLGKYGVDD